MIHLLQRIACVVALFGLTGCGDCVEGFEDGATDAFEGNDLDPIGGFDGDGLDDDDVADDGPGGGCCIPGGDSADVCGSGTAPATLSMSGSDELGSGSIQNPDCAGVCSQGAQYSFNHTTSGTSMTLSYTSIVICGEDQGGASADTLPFSCTTTALDINGQVWNRN